MQYTVSLKLNHVFQRLYRRGARSAAPTLALYSRPNGRDHNRLGLTTGAKLGHAVVRNKLRRRLRAIYRIHEAELKSGYDIVIVCRAASVEASYQRLERDFLRIMRKNDLMRKKGERGRKAVKRLLLFLIRFYRTQISPDAPGLPVHPHLFGYAYLAVERFGAARARFWRQSGWQSASLFTVRRPSNPTRSRERSPIQAGGEVKYDNDSSGDRLVPAQDLRVL